MKERKTWIPVALLAPLFLVLITGIPLVLAVYPLLVMQTLTGRLSWLVGTPAVLSMSFVFIAALFSLPFQKAIIPGKYPRKITHQIYGPRRLYGLCWGAVFYFTPVYYAATNISLFRKLLFWSFGYRGHSEINLAPDAWIRDLPLLNFSEGVYVANKATIGTNICLSNGNILVDRVTLGKGALIGHLAMVAPGCTFGDRTEVGVGCGIGIRVSVGDGTRVGPTSTINHGADIGKKVDIGTYSYVGLKAKIGDGIKLPAGTLVADGAEVLQQEDVHKLVSSEAKALFMERTRLEQTYAQRIQDSGALLAAK